MFNLRNTLNKPVFIKKQAYSEFLSESFATKVTTKDVLQILSFPGKKLLTKTFTFADYHKASFLYIKTTKLLLVFEKFTRVYLFQIAREKSRYYLY